MSNPKGLKKFNFSPNGPMTRKTKDKELWLLLITNMLKFPGLLCLICYETLILWNCKNDFVSSVKIHREYSPDAHFLHAKFD